MATTTKVDLVVYQDQFNAGFTETLMQNANGFNAASRNAIRLTARNIKGDFEQNAFFQTISGLVSRRDVTSTAAATASKLTQTENIGVKINRKIGPVEATLDSFKKIMKNPDEFSFILGQQSAKAAALDYINTAILALSSALNGQAAAIEYDATGQTTKTVTTQYLLNGLSKMGDNAASVITWVMHSKQYFDLVGSQVADKVYSAADGSGIIYAGTPATFGRPVLIIDAPGLVTSGTPNTYKILGLKENAVELTESEEKTVLLQPITGLENIIYRLQGEHAFNLKVSGFKFDLASPNPTDALVGTSAKWTRNVTEDKALPGVSIKVQ